MTESPGSWISNLGQPEPDYISLGIGYGVFFSISLEDAALLGPCFGFSLPLGKRK